MINRYVVGIPPYENFKLSELLNSEFIDEDLSNENLIVLSRDKIGIESDSDKAKFNVLLSTEFGKNEPVGDDETIYFDLIDEVLFAGNYNTVDREKKTALSVYDFRNPYRNDCGYINCEEIYLKYIAMWVIVGCKTWTECCPL